MAKLLEQTNSVYYISFQNLFQDVVAGKNSFLFILRAIILTLCTSQIMYC